MLSNRSLAMLAALALLSACSSSHRPVYSGHEESTEGVPGFVNGKKVSPHVKLGQSYSVDGETYVPRNQPNYVEEGMASWYGPGFHGGKTANGEAFDSNALTAAHRTLPLPSIVRVTLLSTGKQAFVRVNDRGPFAHSRIIDLSRAAAEKIGLLRVGVGKVRIEYMPKESQRFADLLAEGREPDEIDLASEVLNYNNGDAPTNYAQADDTTPRKAVPTKKGVWSNLNPVSDAEAADSAPVSEVISNDLPAPAATPTAAKATTAKIAADNGNDKESPFAVMQTEPAPAVAQAPAMAAEPVTQEIAEIEPAQPVSTGQIPATAPAKAAVDALAETGAYFVQLGAFSNVGNAEKLRAQYSKIETLNLVQKTNAQGQTLYHVRTRGFASADAGDVAVAKLRAAGAQQVRLMHE